jgi:hypothetical protein
MALTTFQRTICRLIAAQRVQSGESYIAGGVALNALMGASRVSKDIDLFHDTAEAVMTSWESDRDLLRKTGYDVEVVREHGSFIEAVVRRAAESIVLQWAADSAFRFFPLVEDADFGLVLHPFDLATNKVLALVGRLEVRDWVDVISCHERIQPLGYLLWAACGKDPGFSPLAIREQAGRSGRYSAVEVAQLAFDGPVPDAAQLSQKWHFMLEQSRRLIEALPVEHVGECVLAADGSLFRGDETELKHAKLSFHSGSLRGALPKVKSP